GIDLKEDAERHCHRPVVEVNGDRAVGYALNLMVENAIRRLVVVDEQGNFLGVVTQQDLLQQFEEDFYRSALRVKHVRDQFHDLVSVAEDDPVSGVLGHLVNHRISAVPVVRDGAAVGIITEKDVLRLATTGADLSDPVARHMSCPVVSATWETKLVEIVKTLNEAQIRRVVITGTGGRADGMLTSRDLVRNLEGDYNDFLERKLKYSKEVLNLLPEMLLEVLDTGEQHLVVWANTKVCNVFGRALLDKPVTRLVPAEKWTEILSDLRAHGKVEDVRFKQGEQVFELSGFYLAMDKAFERGRIQLVLRDITQDFRLSTIDALTNIYNRRYINEFLAMETERSRRKERSFSVAIADVDDFKKINDSYGHTAGDQVLQSVVQALVDGTREYDVVGRYGGEEFLVVMPEVAKSVAVQVIERVRAQIAAKTTNLPHGQSTAVTASFGVATYPDDGENPEDLLVKADERLYAAKRSGKNRVVAD
ncbi:MAG: hypothetical protein CVU24_17240, partial [Betaproteobacteria bacterium HGW-Betaproteobacteria-18]